MEVQKWKIINKKKWKTGGLIYITNLKNIRKDLEDIKTYCNVNDDSVYDFIQKQPNNYLLLFQTYLRKRGVDFMSITRTRDLLDSDCFKAYRSDFESECKEIPLKDFIKR